MEKLLQQLFIRHNISSHRNQGILIITVGDVAEGYRIAKEILYELVDKKTALFLSGGKTPKAILQRIAQERKLVLGVVGQVDERYGAPFHESSNELLFKEAGFLDYLKQVHVPFHSMLPKKSERGKLAEEYDQFLRRMSTLYQKSVATLGIGTDGHTAGIAPNRPDFHNPVFDKERKHLLVSEFNDEMGSFKERITMTFLGLSMLDYLLVFVFGEDKKEALEKIFDEGKEEEIPARFLKRSEIAKKTLIITDQNI